jgi:2,3-bisphosphoglycerate-dependent phosphoglycerate mutase
MGERATTLYLVRHGHADWEPDEMRPLSPKGKADALRVADTLAPYPIRQIVSSPYRRAVQTLQPLADRLGLTIRVEPDLRERTLAAVPPGRNAFEQAVRATWADPAFAHPGGESNAAAQRRGVAVVQKLAESQGAQHIAIATHGNLLALILQHFAPVFDDPAGGTLDYAFWRTLTSPDIYRLTLNNDGAATSARLWRSL